MPRTETWLGSSPPAAPPRAIEALCIGTLETHDSLLRLGMANAARPDLIIEALDRAIAKRILGTAHLAVIVLAAKRGRPPAADCAIAWRLWTEAMQAIAADCARGTVQ